MTTLLIGSDGTLGTSLARLWSHNDNGTLIRWTKRECDLTRPETILPALQSVHPQVVINAAAYTDVDGAEQNQSLAYAINGVAVGEIARACDHVGAVLFHYSTDYVFDGTAPSAYAEDDLPNPINVYGASKLEGERRIRASGCEQCIIRTSRIFGAPGSAGGKQSFIDKMVSLSRTNTTLSVVNDETTSPTFSDDLAAATVECIRTHRRGIVHRSNDGSCTWYVFAQELFSILGMHTTLLPVSGDAFPRPARRPRNSTLVSTTLAPLRSWQSAMREFLTSNQHTV